MRRTGVFSIKARAKPKANAKAYRSDRLFDLVSQIRLAKSETVPRKMAEEFPNTDRAFDSAELNLYEVENLTDMAVAANAGL